LIERGTIGKRSEHPLPDRLGSSCRDLLADYNADQSLAEILTVTQGNRDWSRLGNH